MGAQLNFVAKHGMMKRFLMLRKKLGLPRLSQKGMMQIMLFWTTNKFERVLCPLSSQQLLQDSHFSKISQITKESEACVPSYFLLGKRLHTPCFPVTCSGLRLGHAAWRSLCDALGSLGSVDGTAKRRNRYTALRMSPEDLQDQMVDGMKMDEFFFLNEFGFFWCWERQHYQCHVVPSLLVTFNYFVSVTYRVHEPETTTGIISVPKTCARRRGRRFGTSTPPCGVPQDRVARGGSAGSMKPGSYRVATWNISRYEQPKTWEFLLQS